MMSKFGLCLFLSALAPLGASAQWTGAAYIGKTHTADADIHVISRPTTDVLFHNVGFDDRSFQSPPYYGLRAGYMRSRSTGVEAEFMHIKAFARVNETVPASGSLLVPGNVTTAVAPGLVLPQYGVSHGLNLVLGNFVLRHGLSRRVTLNFRAGLGVAVPHPEIRALGAALEEYELKGLAMQVAAGGDFEVTRHVFWLVEYKFTRTRPRVELGSIAIENTFATHHLVTGLGFRL